MRIRPLQKEEPPHPLWEAASEKSIVHVDQNRQCGGQNHQYNQLFSEAAMKDKDKSEVGDSRPREFKVDKVFGPECSNADVYAHHVANLAQDVVNGFHGTVMAYGQTASGKTHTMRGSNSDKGIIPRAVEDIFSHIEACQEREFMLRVSYLELYNEQLKDLLDASSANLKTKEDPTSGQVYVEGLREEFVTSPQQILELMMLGESRRTFGATQMNATSSRCALLCLSSRNGS